MDQRLIEGDASRWQFPAAAVEGFQAFVPAAADTGSNFFIQKQVAPPVEGIPFVLDSAAKTRAQEYYSQSQPAEALMFRTPTSKQDVGFVSGYSSRDDDHGSSVSEDIPSARVKLLCSYGGKILPRPSDGTLRYVGGETRMITVARDISFSGVMAKMIEVQPQTLSIKYQLPDEDLDALVSVSSSEDLENMMEEFDKLEAAEHPRLRVFLFTASDSDDPALADNFVDSKNTEQQYLDAVNGLSEGVSRKLSDASTQSAASFAGGLAGSTTNPGLAGSTGTAAIASQNNPVLAPQTPVVYIQEQVPHLQFPAAVSQQPILQHAELPASINPTIIWTPENPTIYAAVGVPVPGVDTAHLYGNGPSYQNTGNLSTWSSPFTSEANVHSEPTSHHVAYTFSQTGKGSRLPEAFHTEPMYEYQTDMLKQRELHDTPLTASLNGAALRHQQDWKMPTNDAWDDALSKAEQDAQLLQPKTVAIPAASANNMGIGEFSGWSTDSNVGEVPSSASILLSAGLPKASEPVQLVTDQPTSHPLPASLVNFLEDSMHVVTTSVADSCTMQMPHSGNSSNNMPFDLLTSDDFTKTSFASTGSTLPTGSAGSSASYGLDVSGAVTSDSPPRFMENLIQFPPDDDISMKQNAEVQVSPQDNLASSFAFVAGNPEVGKAASGGSDDDVRKLANSEGKCDRSLDTSDLHTDKLDETSCAVPQEVTVAGLDDMLPDVPDISDSESPSGLSAAETEAIARARGLQVIKHDDLEEIRELGSGTFGTVYHGKWRGTDVAIKRIKASCFFGSPSEQGRLKDDFWGEASMLARLHHPNVVAFYGVVPDSPGGTLATVTEFMVNGSLKQVLQKKDSLKALDRRRRLIIAMDAAFGMEYLHDKKIIHFDLKGENLLVNMRDPHRPICKVGDLGLSKIKHKTMISGGVRGTLPWMAPELLNGKSIMVTEKVDVFSFGVVMWELLTGEEPYAELHYGAIIGGIVNNSLRPQIPSYCEPEWKSLMERCWADDPGNRPAFAEIVKDLRSIMKQQQQQAQLQQLQQQQQQAQQQQLQQQQQQAQASLQQVQQQQQQQVQASQQRQHVHQQQQLQLQLQQEIAQRQQQVQQLQLQNAQANQQLQQHQASLHQLQQQQERSLPKQ